MLARAVVVDAPPASTKMAHANLDVRLVPVGSIKTVGHRLAARVARLANIKAPLDRLDVDAAQLATTPQQGGVRAGLVL